MDIDTLETCTNIICSASIPGLEQILPVICGLVMSGIAIYKFLRK